MTDGLSASAPGQRNNISKANSETLTDGSNADGLHTHDSIGDAFGPSSSVDDRVVLFDGITGKLLKETSSVTGTELEVIKTKSHDQNTDIKLDEGQANEISAATLRVHVDDAGIHFEIDDVTPVLTKAYSSQFIQTELDNLAADLSGRLLEAVQDITELKAIDTTSAVNFKDKTLINVEDNGLYRFDRDSTESENIDRVIEPTVGVGRWYKMSSSINDHNNLSNIQGGVAGQHYHLTLAELNKVVAIDQVFTLAEKNKLALQSNTNTGDEVQATEILKGTAELATQAETNPGVDDLRIVTPLKLKNYAGTLPNLTSLTATGDVVGANITALLKTLNASLITSLVDGGEVTINADTTKLDIASMNIYPTDHTDRANATGGLIAVSGVTLSILAGPAQRVQVTSAGVVQVVLFTGNLTQKEKLNGLVQLAVVSSANLVNADGVAVTISALYGSSPDSTAALFAAGTKIFSGGTLVLNTDLTIDRVITTQFDCFAPNFYVDPKNAYEVTFSRVDVISFTGAYQDGSGGTTLVAPTTILNVNFVDDSTGTLDALSGNEAQNFRVYEVGFVGQQRFLIEHGQTTHPNLATAVSAAEADSESHNTSIFAVGTIFRGYISVARAATDLLDDAVYTKPRTRNVTVFQ